jgi:hypothetical protein
VVVRRTASIDKEKSKEYRVGLRRARGESSSVFAQTMNTMKKGAVKAWIITSQRFHCAGSEFVGVVVGSCSGDWSRLSVAIG